MTNAVKSHLITDYETTPKKKKSGGETALIYLGAVVAGTVVVLIMGAWYAFVLWKLYGWFVVPLGAPVLSWWHIWGLSILATVAVDRVSLARSQKQDDPMEGVKKAIGHALGMVLVLLLGWFISGQI